MATPRAINSVYDAVQHFKEVITSPDQRELHRALASTESYYRENSPYQAGEIILRADEKSFSVRDKMTQEMFGSGTVGERKRLRKSELDSFKVTVDKILAATNAELMDCKIQVASYENRGHYGKVKTNLSEAESIHFAEFRSGAAFAMARFFLRARNYLEAAKYHRLTYQYFPSNKDYRHHYFNAGAHKHFTLRGFPKEIILDDPLLWYTTSDSMPIPRDGRIPSQTTSMNYYSKVHYELTMAVAERKAKTEVNMDEENLKLKPWVNTTLGKLLAEEAMTFGIERMLKHLDAETAPKALAPSRDEKEGAASPPTINGAAAAAAGSIPTLTIKTAASLINKQEIINAMFATLTPDPKKSLADIPLLSRIKLVTEQTKLKREFTSYRNSKPDAKTSEEISGVLHLFSRVDNINDHKKIEILAEFLLNPTQYCHPEKICAAIDSNEFFNKRKDEILKRVFEIFKAKKDTYVKEKGGETVKSQALIKVADTLKDDKGGVVNYKSSGTFEVLSSELSKKEVTCGYGFATFFSSEKTITGSKVNDMLLGLGRALKCLGHKPILAAIPIRAAISIPAAIPISVPPVPTRKT